MPRVAPVTGKSDVPAEHHAVVDKVVNVFGGVRGPFSMLLHSPKLAERVLGLVTFFRDESIVDPKLRSVGILSAVLLLAVAAPVISPGSPFRLAGKPLSPPFGQFLFGTDTLGRDVAAGITHGAHEQRAGHHQRFLVGEEQLLPAIRRGDRRPQPSRPDDRRNNAVDCRKRRELDQAVFSGEDPAAHPRRREPLAQQRRARGVSHAGVIGPVPPAQFRELIDLAVRGQRCNPKASGMAGDHIEGARTDRARGPQHGYVLNDFTS